MSHTEFLSFDDVHAILILASLRPYTNANHFIWPIYNDQTAEVIPNGGLVELLIINPYYTNGLEQKNHSRNSRFGKARKSNPPKDSNSQIQIFSTILKCCKPR